MAQAVGPQPVAAQPGQALQSTIALIDTCNTIFKISVYLSRLPPIFGYLFFFFLDRKTFLNHWKFNV